MSLSKKSELYSEMKKSKMYSLPTSCTCGYVAKKNWIEMELHYEKCSQYRNLVKKKSISNSKSKKLSDPIVG